MTSTIDTIPGHLQTGYDDMVAALGAKGLVLYENELTVALEQVLLPKEHSLRHRVVKAATFALDNGLRIAVRIDRDLDLYRLVLLAEDAPGEANKGGRAELHQHMDEQHWKHISVRGECSPGFCLLARALKMDVPSKHLSRGGGRPNFCHHDGFGRLHLGRVVYQHIEETPTNHH